ncbi:MAG: Oxidoreductase domain protein [Candidatus Gottesmanbacteria bacterium GW2011_GWC2_39_8]|uniref:Oxidoreductase domain protein n=1 Tax=Candidatus Gottesmanbacteria bacterium GW2011_GWC2_39_8 TaxID=1618450 RepID=A0A0G0PYA4_9BACT|nr:MAG: Oxidoreductase domain protein [Candidatus Gottesmanbacteria bacterium GW2011_GWC2_39_8]
MKRIALIGYGYWGTNLLRNLFESPYVEVAYCADLSSERLALAKNRYPSLVTTTDFEKVIKDPKVDGVIIATPTKTHFPLAKRAVSSGKDVLIEKPMTMSGREASDILLLGKKHKRIVMVDHTFLFNGSVLKIKDLINRGELGDILYIDSTRANLGLFQSDVNVVFDLAAHDFSIIQFLLGEKPKFLHATGKSHFNKQEDVAYITAHYLRDVIAHVHVSWLSPLKIRQMQIIGTKKMVVYDDVEPAEKVRIYDKGVVKEIISEKLKEQIKIGYRTGDVWLPKVDIVEPLGLLIKEFVEAISERREAKSGGEFAMGVMEVLEGATRAIRTGKKVRL